MYRPPRLRWPGCGRLTARLRNEQGAQLVEFALVLPLLLTLLLGIITGGVAFSRSIAVDNAAREASRYAATLPVEIDMDTWLNDVANVAIRSATGDMDTGEQGREICVAYVYPDGSDPDDQTTRITIDTTGVRVVTVGSTCYGDSRPNSERRVQVLLERESDLLLALWDRTLTLEGESTVRFERAN